MSSQSPRGDMNETLSSLHMINVMSDAEIQDFFSDKRNTENFKKLLNDLQANLARLLSGEVNGNEKNELILDINKRLAESLKQLSSAQYEISSLKKNIASQEAENASLTIENLNLKSHISRLGGDSDELSAEKSRLKDNVRELELKLQQKDIEIESQRSKISSDISEFDKLQAEIQTHNTQKLAMTEKINKYKSEAEQYMNKYDQMLKEHNILHDKINELSEENKRLSVVIEEMKNDKNRPDIVQLQEQNKRLSKEIEDMKNDKNRPDIVQLQAQNKILSKEIEDMKNDKNRPDIVQLQEQNKKLAEDLDIAKKKYLQANEDIYQNEGFLEDLKKEVSQLKSKVEAERTKSLRYQKIVSLYESKLRNFQLGSNNSMTQMLEKLKHIEENIIKNSLTLKNVSKKQKQKEIDLTHNYKNSTKLLEYALQNIFKVIDIDDSEKPSVDQILENPQVLVDVLSSMTNSVEDLRSKGDSSALSYKGTKYNTPMFTSISSMSGLMKLIGAQMQEEHQELMSFISEWDSPSFRSAVFSPRKKVDVN